MARIALAAGVAADFDRIRAHLDEHESELADECIKGLESAISVLAQNPLIGRPHDDGTRELIIGRGRRGYLALYEYIEVLDLVLVLGLRHQREVGYLARET